MTKTHSGGCLCGAVRYETKGALREVVYCHCSQCRRQSGLYYAATDVADADIDITGEDNLTWYAASNDARRGFCRTCGSALFWKHDERDHVSILAGSFDQPSGLTPGYHIFVADRGDYYSIDDNLPQFERSTPAITVAGD
ncbi:aldehyde-activating protein [Mesorhizobium sp. L-8-10]|uniref:GFA family protein n=1 Tax=unclassified Mesorhizobium TaxID=325217 RepID=UPI0019283510|nr:MULTISPECIES: GFA family protein [unclassified Mesorhizobium]BCH24657.1 aldehyde-activating protein [Mesorhizobium sp. L-8-3]BCH32393.1 aldehyde-activating protein [Mesorhizobium sp. L-8-10]